jgi:hypothetical protein
LAFTARVKRSCHPERSEGSAFAFQEQQILRAAPSE